MKIQNIINVALAIIVTALIYQNIQLQKQIEEQQVSLESNIGKVRSLAFDNELNVVGNYQAIEINELGIASHDLALQRLETSIAIIERKISNLEYGIK